MQMSKIIKTRYWMIIESDRVKSSESALTRL